MSLAAAPAAALAEPGGAASATGTASARIVAPLRLEVVAPLEFGTVAVAADGGGSITADPAGGPASFTGSLAADCSDISLCNAQAARFLVRGEPGRYYRVSYPERALANPIGARGPSLTINAISIAFDSTGTQGSRGLLGSDGRDGFALAGRLELPGGTPAGIYRAPLNVVVSYD